MAEAIKNHNEGKLESDQLQTIKNTYNELVNKELDGRRGYSSAQKWGRWKHQQGTCQSLDVSVDSTRKTS